MLFEYSDSEDFEGYKENLIKFVESYRPHTEHGSLRLYEPHEISIVKSFEPRFIWTECLGAERTLTNGFVDLEEDSQSHNDIYGYYVCNVPCENDSYSVVIQTEIFYESNSCSTECSIPEDDCDGSGEHYLYLEDIAKMINYV